VIGIGILVIVLAALVALFFEMRVYFRTPTTEEVPQRRFIDRLKQNGDDFDALP
jgi:uncharacterized membrane protein YqiK